MAPKSVVPAILANCTQSEVVNVRIGNSTRGLEVNVQCQCVSLIQHVVTLDSAYRGRNEDAKFLCRIHRRVPRV